MTMKESQIVTFYDSKSYRRKTDPLTFESKELYELNDSKMYSSPPAFEAKDERWNHNTVDEFSMHNENEIIDSRRKEDQNGAIDSPRKEDQKGLSHHLSGSEKDADLFSDRCDRDKEQRSPEPESSVTVEEFTHCNRNESRDSSSPCVGASDVFETDTNFFTDKNVLACELPELEVRDKEINCHIVKDICVDEGRLERDKNLIESFKDDKSSNLFPQPPDDKNRCESTESSLLESANSHSANQCGSKEENDGKLVAQGWLQSSPDSSFDMDTAKYCDLEDSLKTGEANCGSTGKAATDISEEDSLVDRKLPVQEFGTRSFLRSFLNSLDDEENEVMQPPEQIPNGKTVSESAAALSAEAGGPEEDVKSSILLYNSKVEAGSITFNFNSPAPVVVGMTNEETEKIKEQSVGQVQCPSSSIGNVQEPTLITKDGILSHSSATSHVKCSTSKYGSDENDHEHKDGNSNEFSADDLVQFPDNKSQSSTSDDVQAAEPNGMKQEHRNSGNVSAVSQLQYDEGESSFSAASLVAYSGPIAFSGSLSHRSDGSTTSTRSFAFPVLQSEWNSSPVRMAKADRRHFRKQKGWRSGLLCCRF